MEIQSRPLYTLSTVTAVWRCYYYDAQNFGEVIITMRRDGSGGWDGKGVLTST